MATTYRPMGAFNGTLPVPTGMVIGFLRDPKKMPFLKYAQLVKAPEIVFMYYLLDPDDGVRLTKDANLDSVNDYAWAYDDYRPTGKGFTVRGQWVEGRTNRWDFPYTLGEATLRVWRNQGIDPKKLYDAVRANHAALHRATRVVGAMSAAFTGAGTPTAALNTFLGTTGAGYDLSSGEEFSTPNSVVNPNFNIIKRSFMAVKRRIHLATNASVTGAEHVAVFGPKVAEAIARSGEMVNFLKQSQYAKELTDPNLEDWGLPKRYGGFELVVEDTPRCFINQKASGVIADVTVAAEKDYIMAGEDVYFVSRVEGDSGGTLDGELGERNFSTVQIYHFGGEGRVEAFSEPKHELVEGHVVMEDTVKVPAAISGFKLSDVLTTA